MSEELKPWLTCSQCQFSTKSEDTWLIHNQHHQSGKKVLWHHESRLSAYEAEIEELKEQLNSVDSNGFLRGPMHRRLEQMTGALEVYTLRNSVLAAKLAELQAAIKEADSCLEAVEGITLSYALKMCDKQREAALIEEVLKA